MCANCDDDDSSEQREEGNLTSPVPLIIQDMLCTLAKRVLDDLDQRGSLVDMFANWDEEEILEYENAVEYAYKTLGEPMIDEDHVVNDTIDDTPL